MLIVMTPEAQEDDIQKVAERVRSLGYEAKVLPGAQRTAVAVTGNQGSVPADRFESLRGVHKVVRVSAPFKLVSREVVPDDTVITFPNGVAIGGTHFQVMAGPCSVENREQILETAHAV